MASGWMNKLKYNILGWAFRGTSIPANFFVALFTSATTPTADTNTKGQLTEIAAGNGYVTGGISLSRNATDWPTWTEDDTNDRGLIQIRDLVWTAAGGPIPSSGSGARWSVLTDDNATQNNRETLSWFDLVSDRTVSDGQTLTLQNCELRIT